MVVTFPSPFPTKDPGTQNGFYNRLVSTEISSGFSPVDPLIRYTVSTIYHVVGELTENGIEIRIDVLPYDSRDPVSPRSGVRQIPSVISVFPFGSLCALLI